MTIFLKASTEQELRSALVAAGFMPAENAEDDGAGPAGDYSWIGQIDGATGWHANVLPNGTFPMSLLDQHIISPVPATPYRVYA